MDLVHNDRMYTLLAYIYLIFIGILYVPILAHSSFDNRAAAIGKQSSHIFHSYRIADMYLHKPFVLVVGVLNRLFCHTLTTYPGPITAAMTDWYNVYHCLKGNRHSKMLVK